MRFFLPTLQVATLAGEQTRLRSKLGGVPWGLPAEHWPVCCARPQKLLAQLCHELPMLDLGAPGRVLHLFQCLECLGIGEGPHGSNEGAAFVLEAVELGSGPVRVPGFDAEPDMGRPLIGEFWLSGWQAEDDGVPPARLPEFFDERAYRVLQKEYAHLDWYGGQERTRFGGGPRWTGNGPQTFPPAPFEFLGQLDTFLPLPGPASAPDVVGCTVAEHTQVNGKTVFTYLDPSPERRRINAPWDLTYERGANSHRAEYANFGSDGTAYVFIDRTVEPPAVRWLWNR